MSIYLGATYPAQYTAPSWVTEATLTVTDPTGTVTTPEVTDTDGTWSAPVPTTAAGNYLLVWTGTGDGQTDIQQDQFSCISPAIDLVPFQDAKTFLNISATDTSKDDKIRDWLRSATAIVEMICGPLTSTSRTDVFDGGNEELVLPFRWVMEITDMHETRGTTNYELTEQPLGTQNTTAFGYTWDRNTNHIVRRSSGSTPTNFPDGKDVVSVTYTLGMQVIPQDIQEAVKLYIKHRYTQSESNSTKPFAATQDDEQGAVMVGNFLVPYAVTEALEPYKRRPGIF